MIALLGISHKSAPIDIRGKYVFDAQEKSDFANLLQADAHCSGLVIISTCNRTEIYIHSLMENETEIFEFMTSAISLFKKKEIDFSSFFYFKTDIEAVRHLFEVACGLDSLILGEDQVIGQVKDAFKFAQDNKLTDHVISRLFIKATETGKRVRSETQINKGAASVSYAAVEMCSDIYPDLQNRTIMLIGAGQTGELTMQCLQKKSRPTLFITNRTFEKAAEIAEHYHGTAFRFSELKDYLPLCDLIITATASKEYIITQELVQTAMRKREGKSQIYIDLCVPPNVDHQVTKIENVFHYKVDDLEEVVTKNTERRKQAYSESQEIIEQYISNFTDWLDAQSLNETIKSVKKHFSVLQKTELETYKHHQKTEICEKMEDFSDFLTEKYTNFIVRKIKEITQNGRNADYVKVINDLFEP